MSDGGRHALVIYYIANGHAVRTRTKAASLASSMTPNLRRRLRHLIGFP
jgi:hypothetical protein